MNLTLGEVTENFNTEDSSNVKCFTDTQSCDDPSNTQNCDALNPLPTKEHGTLCWLHFTVRFHSTSFLCEGTTEQMFPFSIRSQGNKWFFSTCCSLSDTLLHNNTGSENLCLLCLRLLQWKQRYNVLPKHLVANQTDTEEKKKGLLPIMYF